VRYRTTGETAGRGAPCALRHCRHWRKRAGARMPPPLKEGGRAPSAAATGKRRPGSACLRRRRKGARPRAPPLPEEGGRAPLSSAVGGRGPGRGAASAAISRRRRGRWRERGRRQGAHALAMVGGGTERRRRGWRRRGDGRAACGVEVAGRQRRGGSARREASVVCVCCVGAWVALKTGGRKFAEYCDLALGKQ